MITARTASADDTRKLAEQLATVLRAGDIILLSGDLGAGKTTWTQGLGRGLGVTDRVTSPTFTLVQTYPGRLQLLHADVYRLEHLQEVVDLGLPELVEEDAVAVVEWGDLAAPAMPADYLSVSIGFGGGPATSDVGTADRAGDRTADGAGEEQVAEDAGDDERTFTFAVVGGSWAARVDALADAVAPWLVDAGGVR